MIHLHSRFFGLFALAAMLHDTSVGGAGREISALAEGARAYSPARLVRVPRQARDGRFHRLNQRQHRKRRRWVGGGR